MPDNISLHGLLILPKEKRKYPVILTRSPYPGKEGILLAGTLFAMNDYAFILVSIRGTGKSQGEWLPFENDHTDGKAVIDWVGKQDWCNGNIGTFGLSYPNFAQWCIADYSHPMLKAMVISVYGGHQYHNFYRRGMFYEMIWSGWTTNMIEDNRFKIFTSEEDWNLRQIAYNLPIQTQLGESLKGRPCEWYKRLITAPREDGKYWGTGFWKEMNEIPEKINIPLFLIGGWYDPFVRSQIESYRRLSNDVKKKSRFLIGPWNHIGFPCGSLSYSNLDIF